MRKNSLFIWVAVCFFTSKLYAQDTSTDPFYDRYASTQKKYTFAIQPMQWFNWSLRFDFEMRLGDGPGWLQFGPAAYFLKNGDRNDSPHYIYDENDYFFNYWYHDISLREPFSKMGGGGLDVNYKHFINVSRSFYCAAGLSYTHFKIDYWGRAWNHYIEDGLQYHAYMLDYRTQHINRLGVNTYFGYQIPTRKAFLFDMFWGLAYRHSFSDKNKPSFNETMISYGYTGIVFLTGVRIGFGIK